MEAGQLERGRSMDVQRLGKRIEDLRQARDWGQQELSHASRVPVPTIYRIEKGTIPNPGIDKVVAIARALDVSVSELLGETPQEDQTARTVYRLVLSLEVVDQLGFIAALARCTADQMRAVQAIVDAFHNHGMVKNGIRVSRMRYAREEVEPDPAPKAHEIDLNHN
jgi:transcriptional regulator with XRE-family HTH domain